LITVRFHVAQAVIPPPDGAIELTLDPIKLGVSIGDKTSVVEKENRDETMKREVDKKEKVEEELPEVQTETVEVDVVKA